VTGVQTCALPISSEFSQTNKILSMGKLIFMEKV
jgi:hypothetical protein